MSENFSWLNSCVIDNDKRETNNDISFERNNLTNNRYKKLASIQKFSWSFQSFLKIGK